MTHKTFHRYTVRAKRGTAQGLRDALGAAPRSAGASLRRYNEATLRQVSEVLRPCCSSFCDCHFSSLNITVQEVFDSCTFPDLLMSGYSLKLYRAEQLSFPGSS